MLKKTLFRTQAGSNPVAIWQPAAVAASHSMPPVPVFPETLLLLELEAQERSADLRRICEVVLSDLGATLQILRLAGEEYGDSEDRPHRIEDCIADLGLGRCLEAVAAQTVNRNANYNDIMEMWAHAREIARHSRLIAEELSGVNPEQAYLVGLLHSIGLLPTVLGWDECEADAHETALNGFTMATQWSLPQFVVDSFNEMRGINGSSRWNAILKMAHQRASSSSVDCPFQPEVRPLLYQRFQSDFVVHGGFAAV